MHQKLNARSAFLLVVLYLTASIVVSVLASLLLGGIRTSPTDRLVDGVIDSSLWANLVVMAGLLFVSTWVFRESRRDIFFERRTFSLSKGYFLFPLVLFAVPLFALTQIDYSAYSAGVIALVLVASLTIGVNEEIVTRGILLVGLRNSGVAEWIAWLVTASVFALLHLVNVVGGTNLTIVLVTVAAGTLYYVSRRVAGNLFLPVGLHAFYDFALFLLIGKYAVGEDLPGRVLDIHLASFLLLFVASLLFVVFGRGLLKQESTGWPATS